MVDEPDGSWIGVDLDGTLATYDGWTAWNVFGEPVPRMVRRVQSWLAEGKTVKIFTARVSGALGTCPVTGVPVTVGMMAEAIQDWLEGRCGLPRLDCTATKDHNMVELWDDRCVQVVTNVGETLAERHEAELDALRRKQ